MPAISPADSGAISAAASTPAAVSIIASVGLPTASLTPFSKYAEAVLGRTAKSAADRDTASTSSECHSLPTALTRIATGIGHSLATASSAAARASALSSGFTASSRSRTTMSAADPFAFSIARGLDAGRNSTDRMANRSGVTSIFLPLEASPSHHVGQGRDGEWKC